MYKEHEQLETISDDLTLWKYMDFLKFVNILTTEQIWFNKIKCFEDIYEGTYPTANQSQRIKMYDGNPPSQNIYDTAEQYERERLYVSCFHNNEFESAAMWSLYAKDGGLAIKTSGKKLKKCFDCEQKDIFISPVTYLDYTRDFLPEGNLFYLGTHKRKSFSHENEVRCLFLNQKEQQNDNGVYMNVDVLTLIEEIYISPYAPPYMQETVEKLLEKFQYKIPVIKSPLYT